ncbi:MAG: hypothetical protein ACOC0P_07280 [Planctomycetota bacterium]
MPEFRARQRDDHASTEPARRQTTHGRKTVPDFFLFFDATSIDNKPTGATLPRMHRMDVVYTAEIFPRSVPLGTPPPTDHLRQLALRLANEVQAAPAPYPICLDWEPRELRPNQPADDYLKAAEVYMTIVGSIRSIAPGLRLGPYGIIPEREYWHRDAAWRADAMRRLWGAPLPAGDSATAAEEKASDADLNDADPQSDDGADSASGAGPTISRDPSTEGDASSSAASFHPPRHTGPALAPRGLADVFDFSCPSIYAFYDDLPGWRAYAVDNLQLAREYQKPVYAFIMPSYHPSNRELGRRPLGERYWRMAIETCLEHADGLVVWTDPEAEGGGPGRRPTWTSPWWWPILQDYLST